MTSLISVYRKGLGIDLLSKHYKILYQILSEREPHQNISHREMPTYENHIKFVDSKPYKDWWIIYNNGPAIGSVYISKNNEIGLFILKEFQGKGYGSQALHFILENNKHTVFRANINPQNFKSIGFFKKFGFLWKPDINILNITKIEPRQYTYVRFATL